MRLVRVILSTGVDQGRDLGCCVADGVVMVPRGSDARRLAAGIRYRMVMCLAHSRLGVECSACWEDRC